MMRSSCASDVLVGRRLEGGALGERAQARRARPQRKALGSAFAHARGGPRLVDLQQQLTFLDHIAFAHQDLGDHAAVERLHDLQLTRRNHLAVALGHFLDMGQRGPDDQQDHHAERGAHDQLRTVGALARHHRVGFELEARELGRQFTIGAAAEQAPRQRRQQLADRLHDGDETTAEPTSGARARIGGGGSLRIRLLFHHAALAMRPLASASMMRSRGPSATTRPPSITITRVTIASIEVRCVTSTTVLSCAKLAILAVI